MPRKGLRLQQFAGTERRVRGLHHSSLRLKQRSPAGLVSARDHLARRHRYGAARLPVEQKFEHLDLLGGLQVEGGCFEQVWPSTKTRYRQGT
jgi:hypothetical protein